MSHLIKTAEGKTRMLSKAMTLGLGLFLTAQPTAHAKLHFTELKGMQEHVKLKPEFEYLDPIGAFNFQRQGFLVNLVNYPEQISSVGKQGNPILIDDEISTWVKSVFVAPQHTDSPTFFQVSPLANNFVRFLGPSA